MPPVSSSADRTAGRAGAPRPRRPGWRRLFELWSPALEALVSHTRWRLDGTKPTMKTEGGELDRVGGLEGGFNRLARDFDRALHLARRPWTQLLIIQQAREASWTRAQIDRSPHSYPFRLNLTDVARLARAERSNISRQHAKVVEARIFNDLGDGRYLINRDFRLWIDEDGRPLLSPEQVRWCLEVRRRRKAVSPATQPPVSSATRSGSDAPCPQLHEALDSATRPPCPPLHGPLDSATRDGVAGPCPPLHGPDPSPIYESRTPAGAHAPARRVSEETTRDPEEQQQRPPGQKVDEAEVAELIKAARDVVHFLIDPDDCTYRDLRDNLRVWLAKPHVDRALILEAFERVKARKRGPRPNGFVAYVEPIILEMRDRRAAQERLWSAEPGEADGPIPRPHAPRATSKSEAAWVRLQEEAARDKAQRKEMYGGED